MNFAPMQSVIRRVSSLSQQASLRHILVGLVHSGCRSLRQPMILLLVFGFSIGSLNSAIAWQENPFGAAAQATEAQDATRQNNPASTPIEELEELSSTALVVRSIADSNPQTPEKLIVAIDTLLNLDQDAAAKTYLSRLTQALTDADDVRLHTLHRDFGSPFFIELASRDSLQPEGRALADNVLNAAWRYNYNPIRLNGLTKQLDDDNIYVRTDALSKLKQAGSSGAAAIINALADPERQKQYSYLRTALIKFGTDATDPLIGAALSDNRVLQLEASQLLGFFADRQAKLALYHPFVASDSKQIRSVAQQALKKHFGYVPSQGEVESALYQAAKNYGAPTPVDPYEPEAFVNVWRWNDQNGLTPQRVRADVAKQMKAARFAEALLFARPDEPSYQQLYLVSALQAMKTAGGVDMPLDSAFADSIRRRFSPQQISSALDSAMDRKLDAAAIAAAELLEQFNNPFVLRSDHGSPSPLVRALQYGDQRVSYAAAKAISAMPLTQPFAGSSQYLKTLVYLASSMGQRKVLVAHQNPAIARSLADSAARSGYAAETIISSRQLFDVATSDPDLELILISDSMNRPDYLELIQLLRKDWRSRMIPVGIMHSPSHRERIELFLQNDALLMAWPITSDPGIVARQLSHLRLRGGIDQLRPDIRLDHARWARQKLAELTERETPAIKYDFAAHQETIAGGLFEPATSAASSKVLGRVGTPYAQKQLISAASSKGLPIEARQAAIDALGRAFKENGILLTRPDILAQYQIYNQSVNEPDESRQILSTILDLLEKKK